jgi:hypothetical protein
MTFECNFCKKTFAKETTLETHMCEPKRRHREQSERGVQLGLQAYVKFYEIAQGSTKARTFKDFAESAYYKAFVKFGRYCVTTHVINPVRYMDWLLKNTKKIDKWASDQLYTEYLIWYLPIEAAEDALHRAVEQSIRWEEKTGHPAKDMLRYGNANALCYDITAGRVSPWVIYNSESGVQFLNNLSTEQVTIVWPYINSDVWQKRFQDHPADQMWVKDILKKAGW